MDKKQQDSKNKFGTLTATSDANGEYSSVTSSTSKNNSQSKTAQQGAGGSQGNSSNQQNNTGAKKQQAQASKSQYGTLTAKADANNDYYE